MAPPFVSGAAPFQQSSKISCALAFSPAPEPFDPMEKAFHALARNGLSGATEPQEAMQLVRTYRLRPELLAVTQVWKSGANDRLLIAAKGAPEAMARLSNLSDEEVCHVQE